jgi:hypothetical protein
MEGFDYTSPKDNTRGSISLNHRQSESIGATLRDLGVAPDSASDVPATPNHQRRHHARPPDHRVEGRRGTYWNHRLRDTGGILE